jgi:positive regulator of sigma E activity
MKVTVNPERAEACMNCHQRRECNDRKNTETQGRKKEHGETFPFSRLPVFALHNTAQGDLEI